MTFFCCICGYVFNFHPKLTIQLIEGHFIYDGVSIFVSAWSTPVQRYNRRLYTIPSRVFFFYGFKTTNDIKLNESIWRKAESKTHNVIIYMRENFTHIWTPSIWTAIIHCSTISVYNYLCCIVQTFWFHQWLGN